MSLAIIVQTRLSSDILSLWTLMTITQQREFQEVVGGKEKKKETTALNVAGRKELPF